MVFELISPEIEYEKNPDIKKEDIIELSKWMETQTRLPKISELQLISFYHSCYGCMELTKKTIEINFTMRTQWDAVFADIDPLSPQNVLALESLMITFLPGVTKDGYKAIYCRLLKYKPSEFILENAGKASIMLIDLNLLQEGTHPGMVMVVDMERVALGHLTRFSLITLKKTMKFLQEALPIRMKGLYFINAPSYINKFLTLFKLFASKSLNEMIHVFLPPIDSVYGYISKEMLPKDVGGDGPTIEEMRRNNLKWLVDNRDLLLEHQIWKVDETKRSSKTMHGGKVDKVEKSFDKLDVDRRN